MNKNNNSTRSRLKSTKNIRKDAIDVPTKSEPAVSYDLTFNIEDHDKNSSGDETTYKDEKYLGSFSKLLEHNPATGLLTDEAVAKLEEMQRRLRFDADTNSINTNGDLNGIQRANIDSNNPDAPSRIWVNPQSAFSYSLKGGDISFFKMRPAPTLRSKENTAEMIEVYLQTLCRDVAFNDYGTGVRTDKFQLDNGDYISLTNFASEVLNDFGDDFRGLKDNGLVTPQTLFRGVAITDNGLSSDAIGGYLSQFLLQPLYPLFPSGCAPFVGGLIGVDRLNQEVLAIPQHYPIAGQREFGISMKEFVQIQNGMIPKQYKPSDYNQDYKRHLRNGRDMGSLVHTDSPYEAYYNALNILIYNDFPRSTAFPYNNGTISNEGDGHAMGPSDIYVLMAEACLEAFKGAWAQKWRLHRKLRPEAMAGVINLAINNPKYRDDKFLHCSLFSEKSQQVLELIKQRNKRQAESCSMLGADDAATYLLAQMYPEGSPAHPAYPSGHATVAGACTTVIKAIFDDQQNFAEHLDRNNKVGEETKASRPHPDIERQLISLSTTESDYIVSNSQEILANMTVGGELDKLASNIALGRNFGGVHYRQDGDEGILLGENIAIRYLQNHLLAYTENRFAGYTLTRRSGQRIRITAEEIFDINTPPPPGLEVNLPV